MLFSVINKNAQGMISLAMLVLEWGIILAGGFGGGGVHMNMDDIFSQFGDIFGGSPFESILVVAQEEADDVVKVAI